ncbi:sensor histidine kinase [Bacillus taeanensis]|uniref:sensor histidine kinase n=1 Tax=Bacillus taeanensis TaxID=273032 RepID=UPI001FE70B10|nr:HAMP domain-containing sensor histidine kinase [Bacillus taeanensis]
MGSWVQIRRLGIKQKIWMTLSIVSLFTILTGIGLTFYLYEKFYVEKQIELLLMQGKRLEAVYDQNGKGEEFLKRVQWTDEGSEGKVIFTDDPMLLSAGVPYDEYFNTNLITFEERQQLLAGKEVIMIREHPRFNQDILAVTIPLLQEELLQGAIFLYMPLEVVYEPFQSIRLLLLLALVFVLLIVIVGGRKISDHLISPLKKMEVISHKMMDGDFTQRIHIKTRDEIGSLSQSLNSLASSLEKVEQQRREFLQNVSHELRTPLSYIKGYTEAIRDGVVVDNEDRNKYMNIIHHEVSRLQRLVNDLLDLAQLEGDSYPMKHEPLSFAQLTLDVLERYELITKQKNIKIQEQLDDDIIIEGEADRLEQVISNLLDNAIRYTLEGKELFISLSQQQSSAVFTIQDLGPGISEEDLPKVVDRFYRVNKARTRKDGGTGLGLAIVNQIVKKHRGIFLIESEEGIGTTVTVKLPLLEI